MDGVNVIRVVRQIRIVRITNINSQPDVNSPLLQQPALLSPPPQTNKRCLNAIALAIIYTVGIGSLVIGSIHFNDCPAQTKLSTGLVVFGGMFMVARLLNCVYDFRSICNVQSSDVPSGLVFLNALFALAEFGMFIAVCYWTFSMDPTTKPEDYGLKNYCDYSLYMTAFYGCIVGIVIYGLPILCICCLANCAENNE